MKKSPLIRFCCWSRSCRLEPTQFRSPNPSVVFTRYSWPSDHYLLRWMLERWEKWRTTFWLKHMLPFFYNKCPIKYVICCNRRVPWIPTFLTFHHFVFLDYTTVSWRHNTALIFHIKHFHIAKGNKLNHGYCLYRKQRLMSASFIKTLCP